MGSHILHIPKREKKPHVWHHNDIIFADFAQITNFQLNIGQIWSFCQQIFIETLCFLCLNVSKVSLVAICAVMQKLSSEATTSCPNRDASGLPEYDQRAAISFFSME